MKNVMDKLTISEIENNLKSLKTNAEDARMKFFKGLEYLETTKRFKENELYKDSTFETYINDMFLLRHKTYMNGRTAYLKHEKATKALGPALVVSVRRKCGVLNAEKVFKEIEEKSKKKAVFTRQDIQSIIDKNAKPVKPKPIEDKLDYKKLLADARATIRDQDKTISKQARQIIRLKATITDLKKQLGKAKKLSSPLFELFKHGHSASVRA